MRLWRSIIWWSEIQNSKSDLRLLLLPLPYEDATFIFSTISFKASEREMGSNSDREMGSSSDNISLEIVICFSPRFTCFSFMRVPSFFPIFSSALCIVVRLLCGFSVCFFCYDCLKCSIGLFIYVCFLFMWLRFALLIGVGYCLFHGCIFWSVGVFRFSTWLIYLRMCFLGWLIIWCCQLVLFPWLD